MKLKMLTNSLLAKLIFTYLAIIAVTLILLSFLLSRMFYGHLVEERKQELLRYGESAVELTQSIIAGELSQHEFRMGVWAIDRTINAHVKIVDRQGQVLGGSSHRGGGGWVPKQLPIQFGRMLEGETVSQMDSSRVQNGLSVLIIGMPVEVGERVEGVVLIYAPVQELAGAWPKVSRIIWLSALLALVLSFFFLYWISRRVVAPLMGMHRTALVMAEGKLGERVEVKSNDEVGQLADALNYMASQLQRLEQTRRDFLANVSHELRTPLTTIRGFTQGVLDGTIEQENQDKYLHIALDETKRMDRLVNDLLDLASLQGGTVSLDKRRLNVVEAIRKIVEGMDFSFKDKGVALIFVPLPTEKVVFVDPDRLGQIVLNLLDNALTHTPAGGEVWVRVKDIGEGIEIKVKDSGVGIPREELPFIWERFYKVDKSRSKKGTGLGLTIVKYLVELQGGTISVGSEAGEGTWFTVFFPYV